MRDAGEQSEVEQRPVYFDDDFETDFEVNSTPVKGLRVPILWALLLFTLLRPLARSIPCSERAGQSEERQSPMYRDSDFESHFENDFVEI